MRVLERNPRLCIKQISEILNERAVKISKIVWKMVRVGEIRQDDPTEEEINLLMEKYPKIIHGLWNLKVFEVNYE